mmetsp:Transcript_16734/g.31687  ORF Transcript_16734/g.31687 Transcript_16734/m.31687 type:complete len:90 (-) Transcript_16734:205-474(-)
MVPHKEATPKFQGLHRIDEVHHERLGVRDSVVAFVQHYQQMHALSSTEQGTFHVDMLGPFSPQVVDDGFDYSPDKAVMEDGLALSRVFA